jgi:ribosomal protein S18 acetylase RimI-like enzyme
VAWFATAKYPLWDLRCELILPPDSIYLFDAFTPPEFRRKGYGPLCIYRALELRQRVSNQTLYLLVQVDNAPANASVSQMGFEHIAVASLSQLPPLRRYKLALKKGKERKLLRLMGIRTKPVAFDLEHLEFLK